MSLEGLGLLNAHIDTLDRATRSAVAKAAADLFVLTSGARAELGPQSGSISTREGLFALAAAAAMGEEPAKALPVATISALWWTGMRISLLDATRLTQHHLHGMLVPAERKLAWARDVSDCAASAAESARTVNARHFTEINRRIVLSDHLGIFGAAYARDAVMTARLCAPQAIEPWRRYGLFHGLLRKLALDEHKSTVDYEGDEDLTVPDLLMAHACAHAEPSVRIELARLRAGVTPNLDRQVTLRRLLRSPAVTTAYHADLRDLHRRACALLADVDLGTRHYQALRAELDLALLKAGAPGAREAVER